jgi:hypothetical protein
MARVGLATVLGCSTAYDAAQIPDPPASDPTGVVPDGSSGGKVTWAGIPPVRDAGAAPAARPPLPLPVLLSTAETCKLVNGLRIDDPTANQTQFHANLTGTDLGIPVAHDGSLYFFFGDTAGFDGIWSFGDSLPDAVGYSTSSAADIAKTPASLCSTLRFLTLPAAQSVGPTKDVRIERDFAGATMRAPAGHPLSEYIHNPAGKGAFPYLPGDFEVPSGAFSTGGSVYVFYTTVDANIEMKGSYLAKWAAPSTSGLPVYDILYGIDERFDNAGPLHGDFINVAALVDGAYVYLYGTGDYRKSPIHLARKLLSSLAQPGGFERFDAKTRTWKPGSAVVDPIVTVAGNGETSVRYYPAIGRYMMMMQVETPGQNRVVTRFASAPEGPWSDEVVVHDMADPTFRATYCCDADACNGQQLFHCDRAGFYGTYLLPEVELNADGSFVANYLMSTWDPYDVALMRATFR